MIRRHKPRLSTWLNTHPASQRLPDQASSAVQNQRPKFHIRSSRRGDTLTGALNKASKRLDALHVVDEMKQTSSTVLSSSDRCCRFSGSSPIGGYEGGARSLEGVSPTPKELRGRVVIGTAAELRNGGGT
jgi:hypothetical protein